MWLRTFCGTLLAALVAAAKGIPLLTSIDSPFVLKRWNELLAAFIACLIFMPSVSAGQSADDAPIVVKAARLLDVRSGKITRPGVVVVEGERIRAIGADNLPTDALVIDLGDMTLLPGLADMHTHTVPRASRMRYAPGFTPSITAQCWMMKPLN